MANITKSSSSNDTNTIASYDENKNDVSESTSTLSQKKSFTQHQPVAHPTTSIIDIEKEASTAKYGKNNDDDVDGEQKFSKIYNQEASPATRKQRIIRSIKFGILLFGLLMGMFMVSLNTTVVAPAMNIIATELDDIANQTWIATAYLVAMNSQQAIAGKFSDVFGRKPIVLFGMVFFTVGSLINALTPTMNGLIAGRTVQGFGAGAILSMLFVIIADVAPLRLRPKLQSSLAVVYGLSSVIGPLIGGAFVDKLTWRWDFWLNVILGGFSFSVTFLLFKEPKDIPKSSLWSKVKRVDWLGVLFSMAFVCCLLLGLNWGSSYGWSSPHAYASFIAAAVSLIGLIVVEGWVAHEPLMPAQVVLNPAILTVYIYAMCLGLSFIGTLYFGPVLYQSDLLEAAFYWVNMFNMKYFLVVASASNLLGYGLFYTVNENSNWGQQAGYLVFCGLAFGLSQQNAILSVQKIAPKEYMAVATALLNFFMMLASSVGIAIFQALFQLFLTYQFTNLTSEELAIAEEYDALSNYIYIHDLPDGVRESVIRCYMQALNNVFILPLVAAGLGFVATLFIKKIRFLGRHRSEDDEDQQKKAVVVAQDEKISSDVDVEAGELTTRTLPAEVVHTRADKDANQN
ncbi:major facilitator superfamily domain-containing protein [Zychaea mexicana]|uniref:major facilitator superfamily domain-containing protein n=1 Tax=Zychaea mexicana TaxID=64656 RepID=UPI0022FDFF5B|nr:major facilitator superfamily domain-containing protein [Zychaea mexicana]KAI9491400.1 major facilitator superfamily domain-containing protein [Zychaea mexicana]